MTFVEQPSIEENAKSHGSCRDLVHKYDSGLITMSHVRRDIAPNHIGNRNERRQQILILRVPDDASRFAHSRIVDVYTIWSPNATIRVSRF